MENNAISNSPSYEYTYSATRQKEIDSIRNKYLPKEEDKLETLKRLDKSAEKPGAITALVVGITGTLLLGVGMCCTMVWKDSFFVLGIVVGILGIGILSGAYPLYKRITKKKREKVAEQILALSDELGQ